MNNQAEIKPVAGVCRRPVCLLLRRESDNEDCNYRCGQYGRSRCPWFGKGKLGQDIGYHGVQSQSGSKLEALKVEFPELNITCENSRR